MKVEVAYAKPEQQVIIPIKVEPNCRVLQAIQHSGILQQFPEIDLNEQPVGIFSKKVSLTHVLRKGDRIEIYRPLQLDPKEARRLRAKRKKSDDG